MPSFLSMSAISLMNNSLRRMGNHVNDFSRQAVVFIQEYPVAGYNYKIDTYK
jgi:hypothetical protein